MIMGYTTVFQGSFTLQPALTESQRAYLLQFSETRRMKRNPVGLEDPVVLAAGISDLGTDAEFYVSGEDEDPNVIDCNKPPGSQPSLWNQWIPNHDGSKLEWNKVEKFYEYDMWLKYIIEKFLIP